MMVMVVDGGGVVVCVHPLLPTALKEEESAVDERLEIDGVGDVRLLVLIGHLYFCPNGLDISDLELVKAGGEVQVV